MRRRVGFAVLLLLVVAAGVLPRLLGDANPDVLWLSYVGDRLLEGMDLYTDIRETNPPLAVWSTVPAVLLAEAGGLEPSLVFDFMVFAGGLCAIVGVERILGRTELDEEGRWGFLSVAAVALFLVPGLAFGQREHLALLLSLPYLLVRVFGVDASSGEGSAVGLLAGLGFAFKPHFLLVPIAAEAWARWAEGETYRLLRPGTVSLAAVLVTYALAVVVAEPDYFTVLLDLVIPFYPHYNPRPWTEGLVSSSALVTWVGVFAGFFSLRRSGQPRSPVSGFVAVTVTWLTVAAVQRQGMSYHYLPAVSFSLLTIGGVLTLPGALREPRRREGTERRERAMPGRSVVAASLALLAGGIGYLQARDLPDAFRSGPDEYEQLRAAITSLTGDEPTLAALNLTFGDVYALVEDTGARWGLRYAGVWPIVAARRRAVAEAGTAGRGRQGRRTDALSAWSLAERTFRDEIVADLIRTDPDVLLVPHRTADEEHERLDLLGYFRRDERFRHWFGRYELSAVVSGQEVYVRTGGTRVQD